AVKIRNEAEILIYSTEQTLAEHSDTIDKSDVDEIKAALEDLKDMLKDGNADLDEIKKATENLSTSVYKIAELMYNVGGDSSYIDK
ncbi:molecular chaperone DnaK, partial [bacterium]